MDSRIVLIDAGGMANVIAFNFIVLFFARLSANNAFSVRASIVMRSIVHNEEWLRNVIRIKREPNLKYFWSIYGTWSNRRDNSGLVHRLPGIQSIYCICGTFCFFSKPSIASKWICLLLYSILKDTFWDYITFLSERISTELTGKTLGMIFVILNHKIARHDFSFAPVASGC